MQQDQTPVNFDFINTQPPASEKKPVDRRIIIIVALTVILLMIGIASLLTSNEKNRQPSGNGMNSTVAEAKVSEFLTTIRSEQYEEAYEMVDQEVIPSTDLFNAGAAFLSTKVNTEECSRIEAKELSNGYELDYGCPMKNEPSSIKIRFTVANKDEKIIIVRYELIESDRNEIQT